MSTPAMVPTGLKVRLLAVKILPCGHEYQPQAIKRVGIASVRTLREARHTLALIYNDCECSPIDDRLAGKIS